MVKVFMLFLTWLPLPLQALAFGVFTIFFLVVALRVVSLILDVIPFL